MSAQLLTATGTFGGKINQGPPPLGLKGVWPIRPLLIVLFAARLLLLDVPLRALAYTLLPRWTRQHKQWSFVRCLLVSVLKRQTTFTATMSIFSNSLNKSILPRLGAKEGATSVWIQPVNQQTGLTGEMAQMFAAGGCTTARFPAYWFGDNHDGSKGSRNADPRGEKVVLFFHGGGYKSYNGLPSKKGPMNNLNLLLQGAAKSKKPAAKESPRRALSVEYRLTDETTFPGILADALAAWQYLVRDMHFAPADIILAGDSAGGHLALALARYIRDERPLEKQCNLPKDGPIAHGLILLSPWCDLSLSIADAGPSASGRVNGATDYLDEFMLRRAVSLAVRGLPVPTVTSQWLSPVCAQRSMEDDIFDGFPPALVTFGGCELFADEIQTLGRYYNEAAKRGRAGAMTLHKEPFAPHDYGAIPVTFTEEHQRIVDAVSRWM